MLPYQTSTQAWSFSTQQEQLSMPDMDKVEGGKRSQSRNIMPVSVRMLMLHHEEDGPLQVQCIRQRWGWHWQSCWFRSAIW